jgi:predicted dehydrogenase
LSKELCRFREGATVKEVCWGIIGCGDVAENKGGPALYNVERSRLVAVMSRREAKARDFAHRHGASRCYSKVEDLLEDEEVNAVYVATPPSSHLAITAMAAQAGKHVLVEKPMAMTPDECKTMVEVCRESGVHLMVAYYRRFFPVVERIKRLIENGAIGQIVRARAQTASVYSPREDGERAWLKDPAIAGGGFLTDVGTHRLDLLIHILGRPREVAAFVDVHTLDIDVDDSSSLIIRFENGVHATAEFNWNIGTPIDEFEVCGTEGRLVCRGMDAGELELISEYGKKVFSFPAPRITHLHLVNHYVQYLLSETSNQLLESSGEEGMITTSLTEAAYLSSRQKRSIMLQTL